ncbi:MAG: DUF1499 domain-containing protein [Myxococcota bacterium]
MTRFAPVPATPNCVSSRTDPDDPHYVAPLPHATVERIKAVVAGLPRTELVEEADGYLHFVSTTAFFRFKDDLELEVEEDGVHVRSASRVGHSDLGVNRKRVEALRALLS